MTGSGKGSTGSGSFRVSTTGCSFASSADPRYGLVGWLAL